MPPINLKQIDFNKIEFDGPNKASARLKKYKEKEIEKRKEFEDIVIRSHNSIETKRILDLYDKCNIKKSPRPHVSPRIQYRINRIMDNDRIGEFY